MTTRRKRIGKGVYRDAYGLSATVKVGTGDHAAQREKRFPFDTPREAIRTWQDATRVELRRLQDRPAPSRGTWEADAQVYLPQVKHLASYKSRVCEVAAWTALYGRLRRSQITGEHVRLARATWIADGYTPKTVNNRVQTLQHLYHTLDGEKAVTPADEIKKLDVPTTPKVEVAPQIFRTVAANLTDVKTRARFMLLASTGVRPSEVKRAEPADVDLQRRVWYVRTGKGGPPRVIWLNDDMLAALEAFIGAGAWGPFDASDYAKALYRAGWPKDVRPYQARHSVALFLGEHGTDLADVGDLLGHADVTTTRRHYSPILSSRLKKASETLAGRFGGWAPQSAETGDVDLDVLEGAKGVH